jgi:hypothetical protein
MMKVGRGCMIDHYQLLINEFWLKSLEGDAIGARELQAKLVKAGIKMPEMF